MDYQKLLNRRSALVGRFEELSTEIPEARAALSEEPDNETLTDRLTALNTEDARLGAEIEEVQEDIERMEKARDARRAAGQRSFEREPATDPAHADLNPGFDNFGAFLQAAARSELGFGTDDRLRINAVTGASEGIGADGGFAVGVDMANDLIRHAYDTGVLASRCARRTASSGANGLKLRAIDETSRADGSRNGGITAYWEGEGNTITASQEKQARINLELSKLTGLYYATDELLQDTTALSQEVNEWFGEEFGFKMDDGIVNGNGVGKPLGYLNANALIAVAKEGSQVADTVLYENLINMFARMPGRLRGRAVWVANDDVLPQLFKLFVPVENVAGSENVGGLAPNNFVQISPSGDVIIGGRPVIFIEQAQTLGDQGDITFVDFSQYVLLEKGGVQAATSIHVKFVEDETAFRFTLRADGKPRWKSAVTPYNGTNTQSPYVAVAARA